MPKTAASPAAKAKNPPPRRRARKPARIRTPDPRPVHRYQWWIHEDQPTFGEVCDALALQCVAIDELLHPIRTAGWRAPTRLAGWRVDGLLNQAVRASEQVVAVTQSPQAESVSRDALDWYRESGPGAASGAASGAEEARVHAQGVRRTRLASLAWRQRTVAATAVAILRSGEPERILGGEARGMTLADYAVTRLVEAVALGLGLADVFGRPGSAHPPAVRLANGCSAAHRLTREPGRVAGAKPIDLLETTGNSGRAADVPSAMVPGLGSGAKAALDVTA